MKTVITAAPKFVMSFSELEVEVLNYASQVHYDGHCKSLSREGGILYGMRNQIAFCKADGDGKAQKEPTADVSLTSRDVDTLTKLLEMGGLYFREDKAKLECASTLNLQLRRAFHFYQTRFPRVNIQVP